VAHDEHRAADVNRFPHVDSDALTRQDGFTADTRTIGALGVLDLERLAYVEQKMMA
jgi:hypothetical protein